MNEPANDGSGVVGRAAHGLGTTAATLGIGAGIAAGAYFGGKTMLKNYRKESTGGVKNTPKNTPKGPLMPKANKPPTTKPSAIPTEDFFKARMDSQNPFSGGAPNGFNPLGDVMNEYQMPMGNSAPNQRYNDLKQPDIKRRLPKYGKDTLYHGPPMADFSDPRMQGPRPAPRSNHSTYTRIKPDNSNAHLFTKGPNAGKGTSNHNNGPTNNGHLFTKGPNAGGTTNYNNGPTNNGHLFTKGPKAGKGIQNHTRNTTSSGHLFTKGPNVKSGEGFFKKLGKILTRLK